MRRWFLAGSAIISVAFAAESASAGGWQDNWNTFWHGVHVDFHRNNAWPEPFNSADRARVREPFCMQADNGWKLHNTIGTFLYDPETQELNQAGDLLVKWIVTQAPPHRRAVFVLRGDNPDITAARIQSVQEAVARHAIGPVCPVLVTDTEPRGWSAAYIDSITRQFNSTIPAPRLPSNGDGNTGAGAGGGGNSGGGGGR